ncbi:hypothetical protein BH24ACT24_BH24ACT24_04360 [soil metagenome]
MAEHDEGHGAGPGRGGRTDTGTSKDMKGGGFSFGAAFFGWIVTLGLTILLTAIASVIGLGAADPAQLARSAGTAGIVGAIVVLVILAVAYFAGGYVAGRMGRFAGVKHGLGVWVIALVVAILLAIAGTVVGAQFNLAQQFGLPQFPVAGTTATIGAIVGLIVVLAVTLGAAILGGKAGTRFHKKIDRAQAR